MQALFFQRAFPYLDTLPAFTLAQITKRPLPVPVQVA